MTHYGKESYWVERYSKDPEPFDWYQRYSGLKELIESNIKKTDVILNIGAGNSRLTEEMFEEGFKSIANIDIANNVVELMREKHRDMRGITWSQMDCLEMRFAADQFDVVVDKATLDCVLCGENSTANVAKLCSGVSKVLKPRGVYLIVSYGSPENRLPYLENEAYGWSVSVHTVSKPSVAAAAAADGGSGSVHYVYVCTRRG